MRRLPCSVALAAALLPAGAFFHADTAVASDTGLIDMNQDLALIHSPRSVPNPERTVSPFQPFKLAKVHFVVDTADKIGFDDIEQSFDHNNAQRCKDLGFANTAACAANQFKARLCPYDDAYYDRCCDSDYKYTKGECSYPNTISSTSCGGKYKCYCDTALYPYTSANCPAPKELSDKCVDASGAHYAECKCPSYYKPCDASRNLVGVGEAVRASAKPSMPPATASRDTNMSVRNSGRPIRATIVRTASNITKAARPAGITVICPAVRSVSNARLNNARGNISRPANALPVTPTSPMPPAAGTNTGYPVPLLRNGRAGHRLSFRPVMLQLDQGILGIGATAEGLPDQVG